jgi:hypothetical protein
MPDTKCDNCKANMRKKGVLFMSNSKFEVFVCPACGAEKKICLGVVKS